VSPAKPESEKTPLANNVLPEPNSKDGVPFGKRTTKCSWVRNRLRYCIRTEWKKPERKRKNQIRLGVPQGKAYAFSRTRKGGWAIAQSPILITTITLERLRKRGYESMNEYYEKVSPMFNEPLYTRPVLPVPTRSGYSGVRASPCHVLHGGAGYSISGCSISRLINLSVHFNLSHLFNICNLKGKATQFFVLNHLLKSCRTEIQRLWS
jgi:hypothetical protein